MGLCHQINDQFKLTRKDWCALNTLQLTAARVAGLDMGCIPGEHGLATAEMLKASRHGKIKAMFLLNADEIETEALEETFVIYQGHHGDKGAQIADVILPGCAYTEKEGLYVNAEGRPQYGYRACPAPGIAMEDWRILDELCARLQSKQPREHITDVRQDLFKQFPHLSRMGEITHEGFKPFLQSLKMPDHFLKDPFKESVLTITKRA